MKSYFVYFIQRKDCLGPIKIGVSCDVKRRLNGLQTGNSDKLFVLGVEEFSSEAEAYKMESYLHRSFESLKLKGEWFMAEPWLIEIVARWTVPFHKRSYIVEFPDWNSDSHPELEEVVLWTKEFYKSRRVPFHASYKVGRRNR